MFQWLVFTVMTVGKKEIQLLLENSEIWSKLRAAGEELLTRPHQLHTTLESGIKDRFLASQMF